VIDDDVGVAGAAEARAAWRLLPAPMARAVELAWESTCAGSLGIGATLTDGNGELVATGRNRILEQDAGDDHLAGSALAHAEMNVLAKLPWSARRGSLTLWTTLQPCLQCTGAIRIARIDHVHVLAPDPLFREVDRVRDISPFIASKWPVHARHDADAIAAFALLLPTHLTTFWGEPNEEWQRALPAVTEFAQELIASGELIDLAAERSSVEDVLAALWARLTPCSDEVETLWSVG
jgi:tRNA(Arg) A34 adenosine deaminase TadA